MLTEFILSHNGSNDNAYLLSTIVSSKLITRQAEAYSASHESTLTGFKHLGNLAWKLVNEEKKDVLFAFEESIGFMIGTSVYEKDGLSALLLSYHMINALTCSLEEYLTKIYEKYGHFVQYNSYYFCPASLITSLFKTLRERIAGNCKLQVVKDYAPSHMISLNYDNHVSIIIRNSGTEPKLKFYSETSKGNSDNLKQIVQSVLGDLLLGLNLIVKND